MKMPVRECNVFSIAPVLKTNKDVCELHRIPSAVHITPLCVLSGVGWRQYAKHEGRLFYKMHGRKHNDKHIKRIAKNAPEMSGKQKPPSPTDTHGICYFLTGRGLATVKALVVLMKDFKEDKITLICKRTLSSSEHLGVWIMDDSSGPYEKQTSEYSKIKL